MIFKIFIGLIVRVSVTAPKLILNAKIFDTGYFEILLKNQNIIGTSPDFPCSMLHTSRGSGFMSLCPVGRKSCVRKNDVAPRNKLLNWLGGRIAQRQRFSFTTSGHGFDSRLQTSF